MSTVQLSQCKICRSTYRLEIEKMLMTEGYSYVRIIEEMSKKGFGINLPNLSRHKNKHMLRDATTVETLSKSSTSLIRDIDTEMLTPDQMLEYVTREAIGGIEALKLLPVSHYTLNARNNFLSTIRQIAEARLKAQGTGDKEDITTLINEQLKARGMMVDVTPK